jgi:hypothetical protein
LQSTRDRLHQCFGRSSSGSSKRIVDGTAVVERWTVDPWLAPVTMNEITRNDGAHADSGGHASTTPVSPAEFQGVLTKSLEHVYLITAEAVSAAEPAERLPVLHEHPWRPDPRAGVQHELEPQRAEVPAARESEGDAREGESAQDADWLVRDLLDLRWIVSIRIE